MRHIGRSTVGGRQLSRFRLYDHLPTFGFLGIRRRCQQRRSKSSGEDDARDVCHLSFSLSLTLARGFQSHGGSRNEIEAGIGEFFRVPQPAKVIAKIKAVHE